MPPLLFEVDGPLAEHPIARLADRFLAGAGLSASHRDQAIAQTSITVRVIEKGRSFELDFTLPLGSGNRVCTCGTAQRKRPRRLRTTPPREESRTCSGTARTSDREVGNPNSTTSERAMSAARYGPASEQNVRMAERDDENFDWNSMRRIGRAKPRIFGFALEALKAAGQTPST